MLSEHQKLKDKSKLLDKAIIERDILARDKSELEKILQSETKNHKKAIDDLKQHEVDL